MESEKGNILVISLLQQNTEPKQLEKDGFALVSVW